MPKILKILGKSLLCFIGLAAAGWGVQKLTDVCFFLRGSFLYTMLNLTILQYIFWFLLFIGYAYTLFLLFKDEKRRRLIMLMNGAAVFLQFYVLALLIRDEEVLFLSVQLSNLFGMPVIVLALMLNNLASDKKMYMEDKLHTKTFNVFVILLKSLLCFIALIIVIKGYGMFFRYALSVLGYLGFYIESFNLMWCLMAIAYVFLLYKFVRKHTNHRLIMILNAAFLMVIWSMIFIPDIVVPFIDNFMLSAVCGNTAIITIALAFLFKSIEKRRNVESCYKDSSAASAPSE